MPRLGRIVYCGVHVWCHVVRWHIDFRRLGLFPRAVGEESSDGVRDCCRHIECDSVRVVVPRQSDADVLLAGEIDCDDVLELKDANEVVEAGFAGVFYAEIIYDESERYTVSRMCEKQGMLGSWL